MPRSSLAAILGLALQACAPEAVEIRAGYRFAGEQAVSALVQRLPQAVLAQLGGTIPDRWPDGAPPLLTTVLISQRARVEFSAAEGRLPSQSGAIRVRSVRARARPGSAGPLAPEPAELLVFAAPFEARSADDAGAHRLARGAWPRSGDEVVLSLEPGAEGVLAELLKVGDKASLVAVLFIPLDSRRDPRRPRAGSDVDVFIDLELVR